MLYIYKLAHHYVCGIETSEVLVHLLLLKIFGTFFEHNVESVPVLVSMLVAVIQLRLWKGYWHKILLVNVMASQMQMCR